MKKHERKQTGSKFLITSGSALEKTNMLLNLISYQPWFW